MKPIFIAVADSMRNSFALPAHTLSALGTCHICRPDLIRSIPDAQLTDTVGAPALDPAPGSDRARVAAPRGDSDGREACEGARMTGR
jgi:hypothetical protein